MKLSICILAHHKPWLMMSSLVSLAMQSDHDFDVHVIYIKGNGDNREKKSYKEFYEILDRTKDGNPQLSEDNKKILDIVQRTSYNVTYHEFENDHGLDTGAWYKFIQKGVWKDYDYSLFLMEGFIFTNIHVVSSIKKFTGRADVDFVSSGHEKRILSRSILEDLFLRREGKSSEIDNYHQQIINKVFALFSSSEKFDKIYKNWPDKKIGNIVPNTTYYCVPSVIYSLSDRVRLFLVNLLRNRVFFIPIGKFFLENPSRACHREGQVGSSQVSIDQVNFHLEKSPYYYGCTCQHLFSRRFLEEMSEMYNKHNLWSVADLPFSATPLEPIWGILPKWLGFKKWFFNGIHRPRKNFITYSREDDVNGMCHYLNIYYKGKLVVKPHGDLIRIVYLSKDYRHLRPLLGDVFFKGGSK